VGADAPPARERRPARPRPVSLARGGAACGRWACGGRRRCCSPPPEEEEESPGDLSTRGKPTEGEERRPWSAYAATADVYPFLEPRLAHGAAVVQASGAAAAPSGGHTRERDIREGERGRGI
jgi:hypothetical protein